MATIISHPAVPLALGLALGRERIPGRLLEFGVLASILPDLDVAAFRLGISYGDMFGHRGFTHSIFFALVIGLVFSRCSKIGRERPWVVFLFVAFSCISHGLLDAMTNGGYGVGFFSPFNGERYFASWTPIEVSPIGAAFFSPRGMAVLRSELTAVWLPCGLFALLGAGLRLSASGVRRAGE